VERTLLEKALKLVSLRLETEADTTLHVRTHYSTTHNVESQTEGNGADRAGRHQVIFAKYAVLTSFIYISKLLHDL
jgi:hypothetical protein